MPKLKEQDSGTKANVSSEIKLFKKIESFKTNKHNKDQLKKFTTHLMAGSNQEFATDRAIRYVGIFLDEFNNPKVNLEDITTEQFELVFAKLKKRTDTFRMGRNKKDGSVGKKGVKRYGMTEHRRKRILMYLKSCFKFLYAKNRLILENISYVEPIKRSKEEQQKLEEKIANNIVTKEDIVKLISAVSSIRDRCVLALSWDAGQRLSEGLNLKIRDCSVDGKIGYIHITRSKTKSRFVSIPFARPYLAQLLDARNGKAEDYLFINDEIASRHKSERMTGAGITKVIRSAVEKAGIMGNGGKKFYKNDKIVSLGPHSMRHSSVQFYRKSLSSADLQYRYGWSKGSTQHMEYGTANLESQEEAVAKLWGIKPIVVEEFKVDKTCNTCGLDGIPNTSLHCPRCGSIIDISLAEKELAKQIKEDKSNVDKSIIEMVKDPVKYKKEILRWAIMELSSAENKK